MLPDSAIEKFKSGLFARQYHLLLGSGISLDSENTRRDGFLKSAWDLNQQLNSLKKLSAGVSLSRVSTLLSSQETEEYLTRPYSNCHPGPTPRSIPKFLWKSVYTFNIDDCIERAYELDFQRLQTIDTIGFSDPFRIANNLGTLPIVHLHGYAREPEKGYVFSTTQYGQISRSQNPWMVVLSELIASEPFIVAGTSLNEPDLEFYLAARNSNTPRINRGPSVLVEPYPDALTESICERHGLILVKAKLDDFLAWVANSFGKSPSIADLQIPAIGSLFGNAAQPNAQLAFFSAFELVRPVNSSTEDGKLSSFFYGRSPTWLDLAAKVDVPTYEEADIGAAIRAFFSDNNAARQICLLSGEPGDGKSTCLKRIAYDLAVSGAIVFNLKGGSTLNNDHITTCLSSIDRPFVLIIDSAGDYVTLLHVLAKSQKITQKFWVLASDRTYREEHIR